MDASDASTGTDSAFGTWRLTACRSDTEISETWYVVRQRAAHLTQKKKKEAFAVVESARNLSLFQSKREPAKCAALPHNVYVWLKFPKDLKKANFKEGVPLTSVL